MNIQREKKLYAFNKRGKIVVYHSMIDQISDTMCTIITETGQLFGKMTPKHTLIKHGKDGRTVFEQAVLEQTAKLNDKRKSDGYKSARAFAQYYDLEEQLHFQKEEQFMASLEGRPNIDKFNTNDNWHPLPMLAQPYKGQEFPFIAQRKYDGVRCISFYEDGQVVLISRGGNYYTMPHIQRQLEGWFKQHPNSLLDGELYIHGVPQEIVSGVCRQGLNNSGSQGDMFDDKHQVEYHVYDYMPKFGTDTTPQKSRTQVLMTHFKDYAEKTEHIKYVDSIIVSEWGEVERFHDEVVADGYEGVILREPHGIYLYGFRDKCLLKVKKFHEDEFVITGYKVDPKRTIEDSFVFQLRTKDGTKFYCRPKGTNARKRKYHEEIDRLVGKKATVRYLDITAKNGVPGKAHVKSIRDYE